MRNRTVEGVLLQVVPNRGTQYKVYKGLVDGVAVEFTQFGKGWGGGWEFVLDRQYSADTLTEVISLAKSVVMRISR
jgi:hypothetical protein